MQQQNQVLFGKLPDNTHDGIKHRVPARDEERVVIEFEVASSNGCEVAQQHFPAGKHRALIYRSELAEVEAQVATKEQLAAWDVAVANHEAMLTTWLTSDVGFTKADLVDPAKVADVAKARGRYDKSSPSQLFCQGMYRRGLPPLRNLSLVKDAPAPETEQTRMRGQSEGLIKDLVSALREVVATEKPKKGG